MLGCILHTATHSYILTVGRMTDQIHLQHHPCVPLQFPSQFLSGAHQCDGDWIVYRDSSTVIPTNGYCAAAKFQKIIADPCSSYMYRSFNESGTYLDFGSSAPFKDQNDLVDQGLVNSQCNFSGRAQSAVRHLRNTES